MARIHSVESVLGEDPSAVPPPAFPPGSPADKGRCLARFGEQRHAPALLLPEARTTVSAVRHSSGSDPQCVAAALLREIRARTPSQGTGSTVAAYRSALQLKAVLSVTVQWILVASAHTPDTVAPDTVGTIETLLGAPASP